MSSLGTVGRTGWPRATARRGAIRPRDVRLGAVLAAALLAPASPAAHSARPTARRPTLTAAIRLPFTSSTSPAVGDVNGDGKPDIFVTSDNIGDVTRHLNDPVNVNAVAGYTWKSGTLRPLPGWPRNTRDATLGLAMADLDGDGYDEVLASCGQDWAPPLMRAAGHGLTSRLYVWRGTGEPMSPWFPSDEDSLHGLVTGHAYAAPTIADILGAGSPQILHVSQGSWENNAFRRGSIRLMSAKGNLLAASQSTEPDKPWHTSKTFAPDNPPVVADLNGDGRLEVVAASFEGKVYAWDWQGRAVHGWFPQRNAGTKTDRGVPIRGPISLADFDGNGRFEVVAGGYDGILYCWNGNGAVRWKWRPEGPGPAIPLTSGIAIGRLRRGGGTEINVVQGDAAGNVLVWRPDGRLLWRASTTPGMPIQAEPAIGDVNADGTQDVVVGGTDGYVYAWDGETGHLLWQMPTWWAPTLDGMRLESVFGTPALADLQGNGRLSIVVATAQRYIADVSAHKWQGFGHLLVFDCGPNTFQKNRLDWPQYRGNKQRPGVRESMKVNYAKQRRWQ